MATSNPHPEDSSATFEIDCINKQAAELIRENYPEYVADGEDDRRLTTVSLEGMPTEMVNSIRPIVTGRRRATVTYDDLELFTGEPREVWAQRVWESVDEMDYMFIRARGGQGDGSCTSSRLHLPEEFPDEDLEREPNDEVEESCTACRNHQEVYSWKYKPVAVYPVDYRDVCTYCLRHWATWWFFEQNSRGYDVR